MNRITQQLTPESTLEDVYEQLALLSAIEKSEEDERENRLYSTEEVKSELDKWLK